MTTAVTTDQRHRRGNPCPICRGYDEAQRGKGLRCSGFTSSDGLWCRCSREEFSGSSPPEETPTGTVYRHLLRDECRCGQRHSVLPDSVPARSARVEPERYTYFDENGDPALRVNIAGHGADKRIWQEKPDGTGGWAKGKGKFCLYRLPELLAAEGTVYVVEGERDVETLRARGLCATTNPAGAGKWSMIDPSPLEALDVVVIADLDGSHQKYAGQKHALAIEASVRPIARSIRLVQCTRGKDVTDHLSAGGTLDELVPMVAPPEAAAPAKAERPKPVLRSVPKPPPSDDEVPWGDDEGPPPQRDALPEIVLGVDMHRVLDELDAKLGPIDPLLYQRANELVTVAGSTSQHALTEGTPVVRALTAPGLLPRVTRHVQCVRIVPPKAKARHLHAVSGDEPPRAERAKVQPTPALLGSFLAMPDWHHVRHLRGVSESPIFRPDGSVRQDPGYDEATGYLYLPACAYPPVPDQPTQRDAEAALVELLDVFCDFPYVSPESALVPISAILSIVARAAIDGPIPAHIFEATVMGSGKTLQCDIAHAIAVGRVPAHASWPEKPEEQEKLLATYAMASPAGIVIDNVKGLFGGASIEQTLTAMSVQFRQLGGNTLRTFPWRVVVMVSGNNFTPTEDMIRRTLFSRLESPLEDPTTRTDFKRQDLLEWVIAERPRLIISALTMLRAYAVKGFPSTGARLASYNAYARIVAGSIMFAGGADVTKAQPPRARAALDDAGAVVTMVRGWRWADRISTKAIVDELYPPPKRDEAPDGANDFRAALEALSPAKGPQGPSAISLAKRMTKYVGRWWGDNRRLMSAQDPHTGALVWWVETR